MLCFSLVKASFRRYSGLFGCIAHRYFLLLHRLLKVGSHLPAPCALQGMNSLAMAARKLPRALWWLCERQGLDFFGFLSG